MKRALTAPDAALPPAWTPTVTLHDELTAIKAIVAGKATDTQQAAFVGWLAKATGVTELEFRPSGERESAFAAGKRFVGLQFFSLAKTDVADK